jgi:hypothetical protein
VASSVVLGIGVGLALLSAASGCARASPYSDCDDPALVARGETNYRIDYGTAASDCLSTQALALPDHADIDHYDGISFNYVDFAVYMESGGDACGMVLHILVTANTTSAKLELQTDPYDVRRGDTFHASAHVTATRADGTQCTTTIPIVLSMIGPDAG